MKRLLSIIAILLTAATIATADNTLRRGLRPVPTPDPKPVSVAVEDTVTARGDELRFSGYDKPLTSRKETFLVTNHTSDTVRSVTVEIVYLDLQGRRLHARHTTIRCDIPPADTRQLADRSWDSQMSYYYHLGRKPRTAGVTPFTVTITPIAYTIPAK